MWYNGKRAGSGSEYGMATSSDGNNWTAYSANPVLPLGPSGAPDDFDIADGTMALRDGTLYFYYSCGRGSGWRICLATSPLSNGINWTRFGIVLSPSATWETNHVHSPVPVLANGGLYILYTSVNTAESYTQRIGVAFADFGNATVVGTVDFLVASISRLNSLTVSAYTPSGSSLAVRLRSSSDGSNWSPFELLPAAGGTISSTPGRRFVQWQVVMNSTTGMATPEFGGLRFTYSQFLGVGRYESSPFDFGIDISGVEVSVNNTGAPANVVVEVSQDNGTTWQRIAPGTFTPFLNFSRTLLYALDLELSAGGTPQIESVTLSAQWRGIPENVTVRLGQAGSPFFNFSGPFNAAYNVSLPVDQLNAAIAAALAISPSITSVDVPLVVTSMRMGAVRFSEPRLVFSLKNPLAVAFNPPSTAVSVSENTTTTFAAIPTVYPPTTKVNTSWWLNGTLLVSQQDQSMYNFTTDFASAGNYTIRVSVENGDFEFNRTWSVVVLNVNRRPVFSLISPADTAVVSHAARQNFTAIALDPDGEPLQWAWRLDGQLLGGGAVQWNIGPLVVGPHTLLATVSDPYESVTASWNITATNSEPRLVSQSPGGFLNLSHAATQAFSVTMQDDDNETLAYLWELDGVPVSGLGPALSLGNFSVGLHSLRVSVTDAYATVNTGWVISSTNAIPRILSRSPPADFNLSHTSSQVVAVSVLDDDGNAMAFDWQLDGVPVTSATGAQATVNQLPVGAHTLTLVIRDGISATTTAWIISSTNAAPILADAFPGPGPIASHRSALEFSADFTDADGDTLQITWSVAGVEVANGTSNYTLSPVGEGTKTVQVRVTDGLATASHVWTLSGINTAPVIVSYSPGQDLTVSMGEALTVGVSAADADGDPLSFSWRLGSVPIAGTGPNATVNLLPEGPNDLVVTVSDGRGSTFFSFRITAVNYPPVILESNPSADFEMAHNAVRTVTVSVSDREGDPITYSWTLGGQTLPSTSESATVGPLPRGTHLLRLVVRDGRLQTERAWNISVVNAPPTFAEASPLPGAINVSALTDVTFAARAADPDGDVVSLKWFVDGAPSNGTQSLTLQWALAGTHAVTVDATSAGHVVTLRWNVTVIQHNAAPQITRAAPNSTDARVAVGSEGVFAVEFEDDEVLPLTITWSVDGLEKGTGAGFVYRPTGSDVGRHEVRVRVSDGQFSAEQTWDVLVSQPSETTSTGDLASSLPLVLGLLVGAAVGVSVLWAVRRPRRGLPPGPISPP
jgi:hypothetical protein